MRSKKPFSWAMMSAMTRPLRSSSREPLPVLPPRGYRLRLALRAPAGGRPSGVNGRRVASLHPRTDTAARDRGEMEPRKRWAITGPFLTSIALLLFVEGESDQAVLDGLFGPELRGAGVAVHPVPRRKPRGGQGTGRWRAAYALYDRARCGGPRQPLRRGGSQATERSRLPESGKA